MKIYTKTGDTGETSLFSGGRVPKHHLRVEAYGTVDELNSAIGVVRASAPTPTAAQWLTTVQNHLFRLGADLATPMDSKADWLIRLDEDAVQWLEAGIDQMDDDLPELKHFILPGGAPVGAHLHVARTVCRRAERIVVALTEEATINEHAQIYLNRLSDWLFMLARYENMRAGITETEWQPRQPKADS
jgi:cob(I)alamin adenosyltransferase